MHADYPDIMNIFFAEYRTDSNCSKDRLYQSEISMFSQVENNIKVYKIKAK